MKFDLRQYITNLPNQHNISCCASSASLLSLEIAMNRFGNSFKFSRLYTYYMARKNQGRLGQDGTELKAVLDSIIQFGVATDATWPFHYNISNKEPSEKAHIEASQHKLDSYEFVPVSKFKDYLHAEMPVIIGLYTGKMFWRLKGQLSEQLYKPINIIDNRKYRGHAVNIIGYDDNLLNGSWIVANSTGLTWGDHGLGVLPYECSQDIGESYAITSFKGISLDKKFQRIDK